METLDNLKCPQFVDFTSFETFNINDGADYFFDREIVGGDTQDFKNSTELSEIKNDSMKQLVENKNEINLQVCIEEISQVVSEQHVLKENVTTVVVAKLKNKSAPCKENLRLKKENVPVENKKENRKPFQCSAFTKPFINNLKYDSSKYSAKPSSSQSKIPILAPHKVEVKSSFIKEPKPVAKTNLKSLIQRSTSCNVISSSGIPKPLKLSDRESRKPTELAAKPVDITQNKSKELNKNACNISKAPCFERLYNQRNKSADKPTCSQTPMPMYQGVKFIPKYNGEKCFPKPAENTSCLVKAASVNKINQIPKPFVSNPSRPPPIPTRNRPPSRRPVLVPPPMTRANKAASVSNIAADKSEIIKSRNEITSNLKNQLQNFRIRKTNQFEMSKQDSVGGEVKQVCKKLGAPMNTEIRALKRQESISKKKEDVERSQHINYEPVKLRTRSQSIDRGTNALKQKINQNAIPIETKAIKIRNRSNDKTFVV